MKKKLLAGLVSSFLMFGIVGTVEASLITIGTATYNGSDYNLIWDNDNNGSSVVWLDYSNTPNQWANQVAWADGLNNYGVLSYKLQKGYSVDFGANNWRLPTTVDEGSPWNYNYNITNSEMGHLFYTELGNKGYDGVWNPQTREWGLVNVASFANLKDSAYWTGTENAVNSGYYAWEFSMDYGYQLGGGLNSAIFAIALRTGQVTYAPPITSTPTPEPSTLFLMATGLTGLVGSRIRRKKKA